jgi:hypothetical protein
MTSAETKRYRLMGADGKLYDSPIPGQFAGNRLLKTYGRLTCGLPDCGNPDRGRPPKSERIRVFFADEQTAIAAGYRPCGGCLPQRYKQWKEGPGKSEGMYPWRNQPPARSKT